MKKSRIFLFLIFITVNVFGQTKKETEEWINQNINDYPVSYGNNPIDVVENIMIEDGYLYFYHHWKRENENYYSGTWDKVALKDIKSLEYSYDKSSDLDNRWIKLHLNFNKGKCYQGKPSNEFQGKDNVTYSLQYERTAIIKRSNMEFVNNGMKKRIEKALIHIIKLNGGNAIIKKEPF
jgi:hypothetical protein